MNTTSNTHVPFAELDLTVQFLFWLAFHSTVLQLRPWPPTAEEIGPDMIRIWDEQKFAPSDAVNLSEMAKRLKPLLTNYAVNDPAAWIPDELARALDKEESRGRNQGFAGRRSQVSTRKRARRPAAYTDLRVRTS